MYRGHSSARVGPKLFCVCLLSAERDRDDWSGALFDHAKDLYGLIHARFILTSRGMVKMVSVCHQDRFQTSRAMLRQRSPRSCTKTTRLYTKVGSGFTEQACLVAESHSSMTLIRVLLPVVFAWLCAPLTFFAAAQVRGPGIRPLS